MSKERELLELAHRWCSRYRHGEEFPYLFNEYHLLQFVQRLGVPMTDDTNPSETINSQEVDRSEPVAWFSPTSRTFSAVETSHHTAPLFLHPAPRKPFVRLSDEELRDALRTCPHDTVENIRVRWLYAKDFARAIEDALEAKNT